ncbi:hypothetical protein KM043_004949 [Ampulex compressa]|nr:hypothetical protein KM043_004949 [Ampulex compressa]
MRLRDSRESKFASQDVWPYGKFTDKWEAAGFRACIDADVKYFLETDPAKAMGLETTAAETFSAQRKGRSSTTRQIEFAQEGGILVLRRSGRQRE